MEVGCCIMGGYLNPPNDGFEESLASEIYVDKSEMIAYINKLFGDTSKIYLCQPSQTVWEIDGCGDVSGILLLYL